ncbi:hypothetical protein, partial [Escherichia coli]
NHVDLYENLSGKKPIATIEQFFQTKLK